MRMLRYAIETVGWIGAALMLSAYLLLMLGSLGSRSPTYQWMNVFAGAGFVINSGWNGAYPSAFINVVWIAISFYGLWSRRRGAATR
jgi:hypothetical protein